MYFLIQKLDFVEFTLDSFQNFKALTNEGKIYSQKNDSTCVQVYSVRNAFLFWKEIYNSFTNSDRNFDTNIGEKILPHLATAASEISNYLLSFDSEYLAAFEIGKN